MNSVETFTYTANSSIHNFCEIFIFLIIAFYLHIQRYCRDFCQPSCKSQKLKNYVQKKNCPLHNNNENQLKVKLPESYAQVYIKFVSCFVLFCSPFELIHCLLCNSGIGATTITRYNKFWSWFSIVNL